MSSKNYVFYFEGSLHSRLDCVMFLQFYMCSEIISKIKGLGLKNLDFRFRKLGFYEFPHKVLIT